MAEPGEDAARDSFRAGEHARLLQSGGHEPREAVADPSPLRKGHASTLEAFANTVKAFLGAGVLSLPYGFRLAGFVGATAMLAVIALGSAYTARLLLRAKRRAVVVARERGHAREAHATDSSITYPDVGDIAFPEYGLGRRLCAGALTVSQVRARVARREADAPTQRQPPNAHRAHEFVLNFSPTRKHDANPRRAARRVHGVHHLS